MPANIADIPLSVIASWPTPNYIDPVRRQWMPVFSLAWQIASTILVLGRFYLRATNKTGTFGLDDLFLFFGWAFVIGLTTCAWIGASWYGLDRHTWDVSWDRFPGAALMGWMAQVLFNFSSCATKISVLLFYRRMVVDIPSRKWRYAIYTAIGFTAIYCMGILIALLTICRPIKAYWLAYDLNWHKPYKCVKAEALDYVIGILSVVSDLYSVALPCVILQYYHLNIPRRQKIALNTVFCMGTLVAGAGIARTYFLIRLGSTYDTSWTGFDLFTWSLIECQLAIICACAPSLRAFVKNYLNGEQVNSALRGLSFGVSQMFHRHSDHNVSAVQQVCSTDYGQSWDYISKPEYRALTMPLSTASGEDTYAATSSNRDDHRPTSADAEEGVDK
ncbi:hypothetical protein K431DRAFT_247912 [Polychaeton citri CBS 116435]|uniref:Rhodopsin domain-containing protein n=1 Tax=Polychaeton citri CBS 116435 TaxID=1314669 RepID=A0A9P4UM81_9PEZI|nr:hypothetical protein K431DRAFT_247912 [Polychaeton citri CBS 116435]